MSAAFQNPYPGLRPFREAEEHLFFGRERQVDVMVDKLAESRFLAVVGTSGSGKSSLVNCGLRPALHRGLMASAGSRWRMAQFRPGNDPLGTLAAALAAEGVLYTGFNAGDFSLTDILATTLRMSKLGLVDAYRQARLGAGVNLLVVVDQFEELFRYRRLGAPRPDESSATSEDATAFMNLLLEARAQRDFPIYIVLTMRSDFLGDCAQFFGLPEAVSSGQYLVPRLTRDERRVAIVGPAGVSGTMISALLVTRLVNDVGDNPDQLSILQHALNRTWARWWHETDRTEPLQLRDYEAIGTMAHALDAHAEKAYAELQDAGQQRICERIFKALTDKGTDARGVRRPTRLDTLCELAQATQRQVIEVIDVFRTPSRSFLMPPVQEQLQSQTVIDISHESLMRVWERLKGWVDEEARSAQTYRRLAETAELHAGGKAGLWRDPDLQMALDWREHNRPNETWAAQYGPDYACAMHFLDRSRDIRDQHAAAQKARRRRRTWATRVALVAIAAVAIQFWFLYRKTFEAERTAAAQSEVAFSRQLVAEAKRASETRLDQALLLGVAANLQKDWVETRRALLEVLQKAPPQMISFLWGHAGSESRDGTATDEAIAFSADGRLLAVTSEDRIVLWDLDARKPMGEPLLAPGGSRVTAMTFSPDGSLLAAGQRDGGITLWRTNLQKASGDSLPGTSHEVRSLAFSADGRLLIYASAPATVMMWDVTARKAVGSPLRAGDSTTESVTLSADGQLLAVASRSKATPAGGHNKVTLWDVHRRRPQVRTFSTEGAPMLAVAFSPDRQLLAAGCSDGSIPVWHLEPGTSMTPTMLRARGGVSNLVFSQTGRTLAARGKEQATLLLDPTGGKTSRRPLRSGLSTNGIAFGRGNLLAEAAGGHNVVLWKVEETRTTQALPVEVPEGPSIVPWQVDAGPRTGEALPVSAKDSDNFSVKEDVTVIGISADGRRIAASKGDAVFLWDPLTRKILSEPSAAGEAATLHPSGRILAWVEAGNIVLWDMFGHRRWGEPLPATGVPARTLAFSRDGSVLVSGNENGTVTFWDLGSRKPFDEPHEVSDQAVTAADFSRDGRWLATGSADGTVMLWDAAGRTPLGKVAIKGTLGLPGGGEEEIRSVAFDPEGRSLAVSTGGVVVLCDVAARAAVGEALRKAGTRVSQITFSPDGQLLAAAIEPEGVLIWHVATRRSYAQLRPTVDVVPNEGAHGAVAASKTRSAGVAFAPDGAMLASGGSTPMLWNLGPTAWRERACLIARRNLSPAEWRDAFGDRPYLKKTCPDFPIHPEWVEETRRKLKVSADADAESVFRLLVQNHPALGLDAKAEAVAYRAAQKAAGAAAQEAIGVFSIDVDSLVSSDKKLQRAIDAFHAAEGADGAADVRRGIPAAYWNNLCWQGALHGHANELMFACENAIKREPDNGAYYDSRGVARTLAENRMGAVEDFRRFIAWAKSPDKADDDVMQYVPQRQRWIAALEKGGSPLTHDELKTLENQ